MLIIRDQIKWVNKVSVSNWILKTKNEQLVQLDNWTQLFPMNGLSTMDDQRENYQKNILIEFVLMQKSCNPINSIDIIDRKQLREKIYPVFVIFPPIFLGCRHRLLCILILYWIYCIGLLYFAALLNTIKNRWRDWPIDTFKPLLDFYGFFKNQLFE